VLGSVEGQLVTLGPGLCRKDGLLVLVDQLLRSEVIVSPICHSGTTPSP
jgi:hypothetical protein